MLRKTVEKNTVAVKRLGRQLPLEPSEGYDLRTMGLPEGQEGFVLLDSMLDEGEMAKDGELRPQLVSEGKVTKPAQILISWDFETVNGGRLNMGDFLIEKNGRKVLDTNRLPKEVLEAVGYRTPTQDYNMMS